MSEGISGLPKLPIWKDPSVYLIASFSFVSWNTWVSGLARFLLRRKNAAATRASRARTPTVIPTMPPVNSEELCVSSTEEGAEGAEAVVLAPGEGEAIGANGALLHCRGPMGTTFWSSVGFALHNVNWL